MDDIWSSLDFTIHESQNEKVDPITTANTTTTQNATVKKEWYIITTIFIINFDLLTQ